MSPRATLALLAVLAATGGCAAEASDAGTTGSSGERLDTSGADGTPAITVTSAATTADAGDGSSGPDPVVPCEGTTMRVVSYNVQAVGSEGSAQWDALGSILRRLDPDVACIEEVEDHEVATLRELAGALGWGEPVFADASPSIGGELRNACLGPAAMTRLGSFGSEVSGDPGANDVGRDLLGVEVVKDGCALTVLAMHAKSGQEPIDFFRRQVEFIRVGQTVAAVRADGGAGALVVMGDFNENLGDPALGTAIVEIPAELPRSYRLGDDIALPMTYDPFAVLDAAGLLRLDPTHEDSEATETWGVSDGFAGVRLDYVWHDGVTPMGQVVYDACRDDAVDADPPGAWLPLGGDPLPCGASAAASDHLPIVVDLALP